MSVCLMSVCKNFLVNVVLFYFFLKIPYPTLPYPTLPYLTLPYPTLSLHWTLIVLVFIIFWYLFSNLRSRLVFTCTICIFWTPLWNTGDYLCKLHRSVQKLANSFCILQENVIAKVFGNKLKFDWMWKGITLNYFPLYFKVSIKNVLLSLYSFNKRTLKKVS